MLLPALGQTNTFLSAKLISILSAVGLGTGMWVIPCPLLSTRLSACYLCKAG